MHFLCSVFQLEPEEFSEGVGDNLSGMFYFLRIGFVSKMYDVFTPSNGHEQNSGRHHERRATRTSHLMLLTFDTDTMIVRLQKRAERPCNWYSTAPF